MRANVTAEKPHRHPEGHGNVGSYEALGRGLGCATGLETDCHLVGCGPDKEKLCRRPPVHHRVLCVTVL